MNHQYLRPTSLDALVEATARPGTVVLAGGTDLVPHLRSGLLSASRLVSISAVEELNEINFDANHIYIGGGVRLCDLIADESLAQLYPVIPEALAQIGAPQHRNQATIGGNLCLDTRCFFFNQSRQWRAAAGFCLKHQGSQCHVAPKGRGCYAVVSSDGAGLFCALNARINLVSSMGRREMALSDFYRCDGLNHLDLLPGEILTEIHLPVPAPGTRAVYHKLRTRKSFDFPMLGVAAVATLTGQRFQSLRIVLVAVESKPLLVDGEEQGWTGRPLQAQLLKQIEDHCFKLAHPMQNTFGVLAWRKKMVRVLVNRALSSLIEGESS